jgi:hypothetical protein
MSDVQVQQDWWQATDGKWYPPERHPNFRPAGIPPAEPPQLPQDLGLPPLPQEPAALSRPSQPSRQMIQAERSGLDPASRAAIQVRVIRRFRIRRLPCGHCAARLPRFMSLAPAVVICPDCSGRSQVTEGLFFRRGWALH